MNITNGTRIEMILNNQATGIVVGMGFLQDGTPFGVVSFDFHPYTNINVKGDRVVVPLSQMRPLQ
jgi:hypothetical protein